jgi:hypothetical protein
MCKKVSIFIKNVTKIVKNRSILVNFDHHFRAFSKLNWRFCFTNFFVLGGNKAQGGLVMADLSGMDKVWCNYQGKAAAQAGSPTASARREGDRG